MVEKKQCQERIYAGRSPDYQCQKKSVVERNGKFYCKVHDPEYIKEKKRKWHERFAKEEVENRKRWHRKEVIEKVCEPFTTEWLETNTAVLKASNDMYEALKEILEGKGRYSMDKLTHAENTIEDMKELAKQAIAKAEGK